MKVHFSAPLADIDKHLDTYRLIEHTITATGHTVAKKWLENYKDKQTGVVRFSDKEWEEISNETLAAIQSADAVIVEASTPSFSMGYVSALTLSYKKPLLMLFNARLQPYILDTSNSLRRTDIYANDNDLRQIIIDFLREIDVDANNLRFNMVLDREIYSYLNWESVNTGKTKAQIVREVLKERIRSKE